ESTITLQILIWSTVLIFARGPFERLLAASNKQITTTKIFIIGVIFNIILNLIVIPKYSYIGAAIATVFTDILVLIFFIHTTKTIRFSISKNIKKSLIKIIIASIIMGVTLSYIVNLNLFLVVLLGIIIYIITLFALKILDEDEILMMKSIFK
ncbi:MAG: polysaccharide biosynthesis C-terminal domain-containing protein, partial [Methanobacteriaceae archaeon]|nr:polysaccharide biosynthesis C-terminal domain-containing protein [Methanobacteriaceae archaeon]